MLAKSANKQKEGDEEMVKDQVEDEYAESSACYMVVGGVRWGGNR